MSGLERFHCTYRFKHYYLLNKICKNAVFMFSRTSICCVGRRGRERGREREGEGGREGGRKIRPGMEVEEGGREEKGWRKDEGKRREKWNANIP